MPAQKKEKTRYEGISSYETKKGTRYAIRFRYQDVRGEWKEKPEQGFTTIADAKRRKTELQHEIDNNLASTFEGSKITFKEWYNRYYKLMSSGWSAGNKKQYDNMYNWYLCEFDNITLSDISLMRYQEFISLKLNDLSSGTVKEIHSRMMAIMNSAVKHEILHKNKLKDTVIKKIEISKERNLPNRIVEQLDSLAKEELCDIKYACYVLMRIGWRRSEAIALTKGAISVIDVDKISVSVLETKTLLEDKAPPKTQSSIRTSILTGSYANAILKAVEAAKKIYKLHGTPFTSGSRIIINMKTGKTFGYNEPNRILERLSKKLPVKVTPHMLRHTLASSGINDNMIPLKEMQGWLGHADIRTTMKYVNSTEHSREQMIAFANH